MATPESLINLPLPSRWFEYTNDRLGETTLQFHQSLHPYSAASTTRINDLHHIPPDQLRDLSLFCDTYDLTLSETVNLLLSCRGYSLTEKTHIIGNNKGSVKTATQQAYTKLGAHTISHAVHLCLKRKLLPHSVISTAQEFPKNLPWNLLTADEFTILYGLTQGLFQSAIEQQIPTIKYISGKMIPPILNKLGLSSTLQAVANYSIVYFPQQTLTTQPRTPGMQWV